MASTYLTRTPSSTGNRKKWTWSGWIKKTKIGGSNNKELMSANNGSNQFSSIFFNPADQLNYYDYTTGYSSQIITNRLFRDTSAWYHIVVAYDSAQSTSSDRIKLYVNGVQETSFGTSTYPSQNYDSFMNLSSVPNYIGRETGTSNLYEGSMTHIHFCDGYAYDASTFGETDSTSGIWIPKTAPSVTYGTNGYFLKFENSVAMGTDSSGNSNTFTVSGNLTQNVDTPSNVFTILNRLQRSRKNTNNGGDYLFKGNLTFDTSSANGMMAVVLGTMGVQSGKYYWEYKVITNTRLEVGISQANVMGFTDPYYDLQTFSTIAMNSSGNIKGRFIGGSSWDDYATGTSNTTNDIIGLALDMDNKALYIHKNGTYLSNGTAVGVPTSGSSRTGSLIEPFAGSRDDYIPDGEFIFPYVHDVSTTGVAKAEFNFGQGYFGTTAVASAGTAPSEGGIFEYDCPSGYQALCTKGINSF